MKKLMKKEIQAIWRDKHVSAALPTQENIYYLCLAVVKVMYAI